MLDEARRQVARSVNTTIVKAYWQVGKYIVEYEQQGKGRAEYGKGVISNLSKRLTLEYGVDSLCLTSSKCGNSTFIIQKATH
ncbi:MAG: DUF1016 N-terminal domain-containing protein [Candidatus Cryptobacteroides sp.]